MADPHQIEESPYGWVIVAIATSCLVLAFGSNLTVSVLVAPFEAEFGWTRADISMAYTMLAGGAAMGGLVWGPLSDRIGARNISLLGAVTLSATLILISYQSSLWLIYAFYLVMGFAGFSALFTPLLALTGLWFDRRKGLALGIVTAGGAIGQGVIPFIQRAMTSAWGWREAMLYLGISYFIIMVPMLFALRPPPVLAASGGTASASNRNMWGIPYQLSLLWLALAAIFCCICMAVPLVHLVPLAMDMGLAPEIATSLLFVLMVSGVFGRLFFGSLSDRIGGLKTYFIASLGQTVMVFWFVQTQSLPLLYICAALFGFGFAGVMTSLIICARESAPLRMTGLATAIVAAMGWVGMGLGGYQAGYFYDLSGSYTLSYGNAALAGIVNLVIVAALYAFRQRNRREELSMRVPATA